VGFGFSTKNAALNIHMTVACCSLAVQMNKSIKLACCCLLCRKIEKHNKSAGTTTTTATTKAHSTT